ncbi:high affinity copper uptake protein 1-like [Copidosoma floridanum]|uniref:high affinity copper uptake protein 1-like n=1 Tax=Copidosoma floridanum TaxID=29053 RepID=UPI0006C9C686|nr:high affinity copper uptake protein 1-like [Copidosoma floridanum]
MHGMSFHFGFREVILFDKWRTTDLTGILWSMIGIIVMGVIYEALKNYREYLNFRTSVQKMTAPRRKRMFSSVHVFQTVLQGCQAVLGYFLMFIFMTYNVYLCIGVVVGSMLGYFLFGWKYARCDVNECCS